ncbi:hypothetical protein FGIG_01073 [Fasciola gigantica]|uniref:Uncharacterized protein n=1 Tax=Fasciola gigantica TaxID=46835 RepID=A0A504Z326_FASGI|nr:hypothetical protein FGIG_01073 [Fasciola gigantica]
MGRQTVSQFIRNCQNLSSNSRRSSACTETSSNCTPQAPQNHPMLSESALNEIYQRIRAKPLTPGSDHTQLVKRISSRLTLPKTTRNCGCQWTAEKQWMQLFNRLFEPHRRFVCLCTMIQFVLRPRSFSKVALLRYVLLFNDMLILTKHEKPYRGSSRHRLRASDQQQIRRGLLTLLRNNPTGTGSKTLNRLLASYLQPPIALFRLAEGPDFPLHDSYHLRLNELVCIPQVSMNNKSAMSEPRLISRRKQTGKLLVLKMIPLNGCRLRLFQTEDCRFGLELWKLVPPVVASESCNQLPSSSDSGKLTLVATLATLTENDYENFLGDLIGCLRESHTVLREVQAGRA